MTNIRDKVWKLIDQDPSIRLDLERGIINIRALARYCRDNGVEGGEDAIISAIRRYPQDLEWKKKQKKAIEVVMKSTISTRSHIVDIALAKNPQIQELTPQLFSCVNLEKGETMRLVQSEESIRVIIDERNLDKILQVVPKKFVLDVKKGLGEINLHLHRSTFETPGVGHIILGELARAEINIYEAMSCTPEFLIFVEEKDLLKAYQILFELTHQRK